MTNEQLRTEADWLLNTAAQEWPSGEWQSKRAVEAAEKIARHVLAETDETRLTPEWLSSVLPTNANGDMYIGCLLVKPRPTAAELFDVCSECKERNFIIRLYTRGDVVKLMNALKLETPDG